MPFDLPATALVSVALVSVALVSVALVALVKRALIGVCGVGGHDGCHRELAHALRMRRPERSWLLTHFRATIPASSVLQMMRFQQCQHGRFAVALPLLFAFASWGCVVDTNAHGLAQESQNIANGHVQLPTDAEVANALQWLPDELSFERCHRIRFEETPGSRGIDFAIDYTQGGFERHSTTPESVDNYFVHEVEVFEPGWWHDGRVVRLDYEVRPTKYTVGHGPFARDGFSYHYHRVELHYETDGSPANVVYTIWTRDSHTILPYHKEFELSCSG